MKNPSDTSTHDGSGQGSVVSNLKRLYPKANSKISSCIYGHECQEGLDQSTEMVERTWVLSSCIE